MPGARPTPSKHSTKFATEPVDLVALDLVMPKIDGYEVLERIRRLVPADEFLPVLVLTADVTREARMRALALADDFLTKPFDVAEFLLRIRNLLKTRHLHRQRQAFLDAIPDLVLRIASDGAVVETRAGGTDGRITPVAETDRTFEDVIPPEAIPLARKSIRGALAPGDVGHFQYVQRQADGEHVFHARIAPAGPREVVLVARDVTEMARS